METATFGAGCFWGPELKFSKISGVVKTEVGFMGGDEDIENLSYQRVCMDLTGHAEVIRIEFESETVGYDDLLKMFWELHDPTQLNMQGPDVGSQYRTVIFYSSEEQKKKAEESLVREQEKYDEKIVTQVVSVGKFYKAEEYHQRYLEKSGRNVC